MTSEALLGFHQLPHNRKEFLRPPIIFATDIRFVIIFATGHWAGGQTFGKELAGKIFTYEFFDFEMFVPATTVSLSQEKYRILRGKNHAIWSK